MLMTTNNTLNSIILIGKLLSFKQKNYLIIFKKVFIDFLLINLYFTNNIYTNYYINWSYWLISLNIKWYSWIKVYIKI